MSDSYGAALVAGDANVRYIRYLEHITDIFYFAVYILSHHSPKLLLFLHAFVSFTTPITSGTPTGPSSGR
jgi:hypothetical protein